MLLHNIEHFDFLWNPANLPAWMLPIDNGVAGKQSRRLLLYRMGTSNFTVALCFMAVFRMISVLLDRVNGDEQISRYWKKIATGNTKGQFELKRKDAYMGRQNQVIRLQSGRGEFGISNSGLNKQGIYFVAGKKDHYHHRLYKTFN